MLNLKLDSYRTRYKLKYKLKKTYISSIIGKIIVNYLYSKNYLIPTIENTISDRGMRVIMKKVLLAIIVLFIASSVNVPVSAQTLKGSNRIIKVRTIPV